MELKINFTDEEMIEMLKGIGYQTDIINSWESRPAYHNDVEYIDRKVLIAFKEKPDEEVLKANAYTLKEKFGIEKIFNNEVKKRIKFWFGKIE